MYRSVHFVEVFHVDIFEVEIKSFVQNVLEHRSIDSGRYIDLVVGFAQNFLNELKSGGADGCDCDFTLLHYSLRFCDELHQILLPFVQLVNSGLFSPLETD